MYINTYVSSFTRSHKWTISRPGKVSSTFYRLFKTGHSDEFIKFVIFSLPFLSLCFLSILFSLSLLTLRHTVTPLTVSAWLSPSEHTKTHSHTLIHLSYKQTHALIPHCFNLQEKLKSVPGIQINDLVEGMVHCIFCKIRYTADWKKLL